jgi:dUTP pyrophosphatase
MKVRFINFGGQPPQRAHYNDAGADVFASRSVMIEPHTIKKIPLGIGLALPDGFVAFVLPRSGKSANEGLTAEVVPIDSGYRGEIHAIVYNANPYHVTIEKGTKIAQIVIMPVTLADFIEYDEPTAERGKAGFGSTDKKEVV